MKRIISLLIAILIPISSYADTCGASLTGPFNADEAGRLCAVFGSAVNHDLLPSADGTYDLGSSTLEWQDGFFDGTLTTDALVNSGTSTLSGLVTATVGVTATTGDFTATTGNLIFGAASAKIIPGATSLLIRNNADSQSNVAITNAGAVTTAAGITATTGDITSTAGSLISPASSQHILQGVSSIDTDISNVTGTGLGMLIAKDASANADNVGIVGFGNNTVGAVFRGYKTRSTATDANTIVQSGDQLLNITAEGADGAAYRAAASITFNSDGTPGSSDMPGNIIFNVTADGAASPTQAMKIGNTKAITIAGTLQGTSTSGLGWVIASGANTACNTTCGISSCAFGADTATDFDAVACSDATADVCICTGATS